MVLLLPDIMVCLRYSCYVMCVLDFISVMFIMSVFVYSVFLVCFVMF